MDKDKKLKKIALIITKSNWGGAQKYVFDLATSLPAEEFEVVVILGGNGVLKDKLVEKNVRVISLPSLKRDISISNEIKSFIDLFFILKKERPDIVHGNSSKAGGIVSFLSRLLGVPRIIFTAHAWAFNENRNALQKSAISFFHWLTVILSHTTIAVSESVRSQIAHLPFMKNRIKVVHLGLRPFELLPKEEAFRMLCLEKTEKTKVIGTIAELHPVKGLQYGIDAFALIRKEDPSLYENLLWAIIGEGEYRSELERMIKEKKLENKIYLLGFKKDASKFMGAFDAFLLPSLSEAFGYVLLEAGFAKVPVITSKVGGIPEIIENDVTGILFMPKSAREISSSISKFLNNPEQCKTQAEIFSKKIGNDFTLEIMIKRTTDIYNYGTSK